jgi:hypothetical protein
MNGKTNKWGPALTGLPGNQQSIVRPTDIAAAIAAGLSIKSGTQSSPQPLPSPLTFSAEFEINDSPVSCNTLIADP